MGPFSWLNGDNVDPKTREHLALNCREGVTPDETFEDWGDYEQDYPDDYTDADHEADIDTYYEMCQRPNIRLVEDDE